MVQIRGFGIRHFWLHEDIIHIPSHALWIEYSTRLYIQNQTCWDEQSQDQYFSRIFY